jgi:hypothetical protein
MDKPTVRVEIEETNATLFYEHGPMNFQIFISKDNQTFFEFEHLGSDSFSSSGSLDYSDEEWKIIVKGESVTISFGYKSLLDDPEPFIGGKFQITVPRSILRPVFDEIYSKWYSDSTNGEREFALGVLENEKRQRKNE